MVFMAVYNKRITDLNCGDYRLRTSHRLTFLGGACRRYLKKAETAACLFSRQVQAESKRQYFAIQFSQSAQTLTFYQVIFCSFREDRTSMSDTVPSVALHLTSEFSRPTRCWRSLKPPSRALGAHLNNMHNFECLSVGTPFAKYRFSPLK